jgi:hydrogenase maturation protease
MNLTTRPDIRVLGVGNEMRGDDGIGYVAIRILSEILPSFVKVHSIAGDGAALIDAWCGSDLAIVVDAVSTNGEAGTVYRLDSGEDVLPTDFFHYSTHAFSLAEAVELARALDMLPSKLVVYGVEGGSFDAGVGLTDRASAGVRVVADRIAAEVLEALRVHESHAVHDASDK